MAISPSQLLLLLFLFFTTSVLAQAPQPKNKAVLLAELNAMKDDTNKVNSFLKAEQLIGYDHPQFLTSYIKVESLAKRLNFRTGIIGANFAIGNYYLSKAEFSKSLTYCQKNLGLAKTYHLKFQEALSAKAMALIYFITQDYTQSLHYNLSSLQLLQQLNNLPLVCEGYQMTSAVYGANQQYAEALTNAKKALSVADQIKDEKIYGNVYCSLATNYYLNKMYLEAFNYCQKAIQNQQLEEINIGNAKGTLGNVLRDAPDELLLKMGIEPSKRQQEALKYFKEALAISLKYNNTLSITTNYLDVSNSSAALKQYQQAYEAYRKHVLYRDSSANMEERKKIAQADLRFQYLKKEEAVRYQQKLGEVKNKQQRNYLIGGIVTLLLISFFIAKNYFNQRKSNRLVTLEKQRAEDLLNNILPADVAEELKQYGEAKARTFDEVSVIFTDFVNFTQVGELLSAQELVNELNHCFKAFDGITTKYGIEKIKTIGDAYLAVSGLPNTDPDHARKAVKAALEIQQFVSERKLALGDSTFDIRIGIHSGSVVAGIVGVKKFAYDIWGDTVNTAARMEQNSEPGKINISEKTKELLKQEFALTYRGEISAKNKGALKMYFVEK